MAVLAVFQIGGGVGSVGRDPDSKKSTLAWIFLGSKCHPRACFKGVLIDLNDGCFGSFSDWWRGGEGGTRSNAHKKKLTRIFMGVAMR